MKRLLREIKSLIIEEAVDYKPSVQLLDYKIYDYRWDCRLKRLLREIKSLIIDEAVDYKPYAMLDYKI